ncbi:hypothetical protein DQ04_08831010 [Trypanosoma grayi]|uniref:hypothetical protein n=1 Tax=Trypanosoma grayi TaxID=71804 RepID=UPI0004F4AD3B|nr:hypothetical protein DQ04_08831010 [Trypanosoma grayi]KEG07786.1 hypothetical protein DQ04_08831010 [Trypanosoma grayi]
MPLRQQSTFHAVAAESPPVMERHSRRQSSTRSTHTASPSAQPLAITSTACCATSASSHLVTAGRSRWRSSRHSFAASGRRIRSCCCCFPSAKVAAEDFSRAAAAAGVVARAHGTPARIASSTSASACVTTPCLPISSAQADHGTPLSSWYAADFTFGPIGPPATSIVSSSAMTSFSSKSSVPSSTSTAHAEVIARAKSGALDGLLTRRLRKTRTDVFTFDTVASERRARWCKSNSSARRLKYSTRHRKAPFTVNGGGTSMLRRATSASNVSITDGC